MSDDSKGMKLTPEALDEFRRIYEDEFGEEITRDQAQEMGTRLVDLLRLLLRPLPKANGAPPKPDELTRRSDQLR